MRPGLPALASYDPTALSHDAGGAITYYSRFDPFQETVASLLADGQCYITAATANSLTNSNFVRFIGDTGALTELEALIAPLPSTGSLVPSSRFQPRHARFKEQIIDQFNRRLSKVLPAVGFAALVSHAGYMTEPQGTHLSAPSAIVAWLDKSDGSTWEDSNVDPIQASTAIRRMPSSDIEQPRWIAPINRVLTGIEDQLRFNYRETIAYARNMGLRTDFPL